MHLLATNLCIWLRFLVREVMDGVYGHHYSVPMDHLDLPGQAGDLLPPDHYDLPGQDLSSGEGF